jgi:hypothetical protein
MRWWMMLGRKGEGGKLEVLESLRIDEVTTERNEIHDGDCLGFRKEG